MHYYQHHLGDYAKDTGHLSTLEHGAYRLLMDHYYSTERPLPLHQTQYWRICKCVTPQERQAVTRVIGQFFVEQDGAFHHKRIDDEIVAYREMCEKNARNGGRGGRPKKPSGFPVGNPNETEASTHTPVPIQNASHSPPTPAVAEAEKEPLILRVFELYKRRPQTLLTPKQRIQARAITDADLTIIETAWRKKWAYHRKDIATLLNNFPAEVERAQDYLNELKRNGTSNQSGHRPSNFLVNRDAPDREDTSAKTGRIF